MGLKSISASKDVIGDPNSRHMPAVVHHEPVLTSSGAGADSWLSVSAAILARYSACAMGLVKLSGPFTNSK